MSRRAIQRLRQDREALLSSTKIGEGDTSDDDDDEDDEENEGIGGWNKKAGFKFTIDDDGDDDDDDSSEDKSQVDESSSHEDDAPVKPVPVAARQAPATKAETPTEDLDALLEEFKGQDDYKEIGPGENNHKASLFYDIITSSIELRGLDIDFVMRTSLLGSVEDTAPTRNRRGRQLSLFGPARDNWPRPPHYVGGGMGMVTYETSDQTPAIPWPYSEMKDGDERCPSLNRWFLFKYSDSYQRDREDFERIKASGDPNALAMFIAHHPFVVESLLQLSTVLYQTNSSQEGLSLLKRALYTYECASLNTFLQIEDRLGFMDHEQATNQLFFAALFRLVRVSHIAGLPRASLATSRFLLSLDPLRDPTGVLLAIDHFALLTNNESNDKWVVDFVESRKVTIHYKDDTSVHGYECALLDMPNWAYSYALALFRINRNLPSDESKMKADTAIKQALGKFPSVLEQLLVQNDVNTSGRSFQMDWPTVLGFVRERDQQVRYTLTPEAAADPVVKACTIQAHDLIARIFVQQNYKLWSIDSVLQWAYRNLKELQENPDKVTPLQPAIMRYARCDPADYEDKIQTMPADANPLDPGLVAHAMTIDTNRPRFMQRAARGAAGMLDEFQMMAGFNPNGTVLAGPPTEMIDPDWPILEVFWRSFLPWAHVEGVPPPPRR